MAPGLLAEAQEVGLLPTGIKVNFSDDKIVRETLQKACQYEIASENIPGMDRLSLLQNQLGPYSKKLTMRALTLGTLRSL